LTLSVEKKRNTWRKIKKNGRSFCGRRDSAFTTNKKLNLIRVTSIQFSISTITVTNSVLQYARKKE